VAPAVDGPVKVAVVRDPLGAGIDPHVRAGIDRAADYLADAGYDVVDAEPPGIAETTGAWVDAIWADLAILWPNMRPIANPGQVAFVEACLEQGVFKPVDQAQLAAYVAAYQHGAAWARFLQERPVVLSPVCCERPWVVDDDIARAGEFAMAMRMVVPVNILGLPSSAVPVGIDEGLPQGVQLIGDRLREDLVLDAAQAIEDRAKAVLPIEPRVAATV
jgi:amidase